MPNTTNCLPEHGWFRCPVGGVTKCIPIRRASDNFSDCEDHSDEGGLSGNAHDMLTLISVINTLPSRSQSMQQIPSALMGVIQHLKVQFAPVLLASK